MKFFFVFFFLILPLNAFSSLLIVEVQIEKERADDCYIKIYNSSDSDLNISGYNLRKKTSTGTDSSVRLFPKDSVIKANDYFVWASSRNKDFPEKVKANVMSSQYLSYNNSIALFDDEKNIIDALSWGDGENPYVLGNSVKNPEKGQVIQRKKENNNYVNSRDNSSDFHYYPPITSPFLVKDFIKEEEKEETKRVNPIIISLIISLISGFIIIYLKKKWQDTVTLKI